MVRKKIPAAGCFFIQTSILCCHTIINHFLKLCVIIGIFEERFLFASEKDGFIAAAQRSLAVFIPALKNIKRIACVIRPFQVITECFFLIHRKFGNQPTTIGHLSACPVKAYDESQRLKLCAEVEISR